MNNCLFETCTGYFNWNKLLRRSVHLVDLSHVCVSRMVTAVFKGLHSLLAATRALMTKVKSLRPLVILLKWDKFCHLAGRPIVTVCIFHMLFLRTYNSTAVSACCYLTGSICVVCFRLIHQYFGYVSTASFYFHVLTLLAQPFQNC
jgi:hypothetical protein